MADHLWLFIKDGIPVGRAIRDVDEAGGSSCKLPVQAASVSIESTAPDGNGVAILPVPPQAHPGDLLTFTPPRLEVVT